MSSRTTRATAAAAAKNEDDGNMRTGSTDERRQRLRRKEQFDALHQEMELVEHGVTKSGHSRRKVPRHQSVQRTQKRKLLEKQDDWTNMREGHGDTATNRIRGSMAAAEERVIQGSLIFGKLSEAQQDEGEEAPTSDGEEEEEDDDDDSVEVEGEEVGESSDEEQELQGTDLGEDDDAVEFPPEVPQKRVTSKSKVRTTKRRRDDVRPGSKPKRKRLQRLRNFRSSKRAEMHGAALGAHVRGKPGLAIRRLKQVALDAPSAPQIYSSLGMVYEDMLHESQRKGGALGVSNEDHEENAQQVNGNSNNSEKVAGEPRVSFSDDRHGNEMQVQDKVLREQLNLAKKAYGSYHIAAILCKRDYSLWLRAADSALEIAALHTTIMQLPEIADDVIEYHRDEKHRWLEEAKNDYQTADNLNPPGIDIPAKLAYVMIELGNLSEALTLLTHLKNNDDFVASYRAWLLYADLMLRIGHECTQWNRGVQTNSNYMFRRWLRKLSTSFDWQERRLQALAMAVEAACGSKSCLKFMSWLRNRVETKDAMDLETADGDADQVDGIEDPNAGDVGAQSPLFDRGAENDDFEREKELLLRKNRAEIAAFDKTTQEMNLEANSLPATERDAARSELVKKHKATLVTLVGELYHHKKASRTASPSTNPKTLGADEQRRELPVSASCRTVFAVASELMRHMLGMQLYDGGRLVGESVSLYLKERAALRDKRTQAGMEFDQAQKRPISIFAMQHETYDAPDQQSEDEESKDAPLSDDDDLDHGDYTLVMEPLRSGPLPPEIRFLYGLCLAGEGGKAFLATTCIQAINDLPQEPCSWLTEHIVDTSVATDSLWILFHREMTQPFGRIAALAFVADALHKSGNERELSTRVSALFRRYVSELKKNGMLDVVLRMGGRNNLVSSQRQNQVVKVLVATTKYEVESAELVLSHEDSRDGEIDRSLLDDAIDSLAKLLLVAWKVDRDGSISSTSAEAVDALSRTFRLFTAYAQQLEGDQKMRSVNDAVNKMIKSVSLLCGALSLTINDNIERSTTELTALPLPSYWLSPDLASLSLRTFNLCVATNVSLFSGWEPEEFSVRLLRGGAHNFFGISMDNGQVAGFVSETNEEELAQQWDVARSRLPASFAFDFRAKLQALRETAWYKETRVRYKATDAKHRIIFYGEDAALSALLSFARVCLVCTTEARVNEKLFFIALSIMLPVSQFCLNESLWDATIGQQAASGSSGVSEWRDFSTIQKGDVIPAPSFRPGYIRPSKRATSSVSGSQSDRVLHEWFSWEDDLDPMSNLIAIPLPKLQIAWRSLTGSTYRTHAEEATGAELMREVDVCIAKLRACYTAQAVEKASLHVAASLLRLAACSDCCNPFLCLQEAAMFASQAPKGGISDHIFQARLPKPDVCTPLDALLILGRADCLQAVHFCHEAAFLCCYVATVCSLRRDGERTHLEWNERWSIVASLAYDLSVMIRAAAGALLQEQDKKDDTTGTWEVAVIEEFRQARADGLAIKRQAFSATGTNDRALVANAANPLWGLEDEHKWASSRYHCSEQPAEDMHITNVVPAMEELGVEETLDDSINESNWVAV